MARVELPARLSGLLPVPVGGVAALTSFTSGDGTLAIVIEVEKPVRRSVQLNLSPGAAGLLAGFLLDGIRETETSLKVAAGCLSGR